jgi:hypothetical protein
MERGVIEVPQEDGVRGKERAFKNLNLIGPCMFTVGGFEVAVNKSDPAVRIVGVCDGGR